MQVVADLEPKIIIPMHFKTPGLDEKVFSSLSPVDDFLKGMDIRVEKESKLKVTPATIVDEMVIYLLERK
jgi:hypothetical protein